MVRIEPAIIALVHFAHARKATYHSFIAENSTACSPAERQKCGLTLASFLIGRLIRLCEAFSSKRSNYSIELRLTEQLPARHEYLKLDHRLFFHVVIGLSQPLKRS